jgi:hypothetical protein
MTISKLKSKLQNDLNKLPLPVLQEIEALVNQRLKAQQVSPKIFRKFGALSGMLQYMALDFNAPLDDFKDYQ